MPIYEYRCLDCQICFESIQSSSPQDQKQGICPKCHSDKNTQKMISRFAVSGQGDLREATLHGCHSGCHSHGAKKPS